MKVLQILGKSSGGIRQHVSALTKELEFRGFDVTIAGPKGVMGSLAEQKITIAHPSLKKPATIFSCVKTLRAKVSDFDLIHAHGVTVALAAVAAQLFKRNKVPIVLTLHNIVGPNKKGIRREMSLLFENFVFHHVDTVISPSEFAISKYHVRDKWLDKFKVVFPTTRIFTSEMRKDAHSNREITRSEYGYSSDDVVLACVARISPQKNLDILIDAFSMVLKEIPNARLIIAGDGEQKYISSIKKIVADKSLQEVIHFPGYVDHPYLLLGASDIFVLSSSSETIPFAVLEALSVGLPVVMTNTGIASEILDGVCGDHVPIGNADQLARQIVSWCARVSEGKIQHNKLEEVADSWLDPHSSVQPVVDIYNLLTS